MAVVAQAWCCDCQAIVEVFAIKDVQSEASVLILRNKHKTRQGVWRGNFKATLSVSAIHKPYLAMKKAKTAKGVASGRR